MSSRSTRLLRGEAAIFLLFCGMLLCGCQSEGVTQRTLVAHFQSHPLDAAQLKLLGDFAALPAEDSVAVRHFVSQNRDKLRPALAELANHFLLADITHTAQRRPLSLAQAERLALLFQQVHQEPAAWQRFQLIKQFTFAQKLQKLAAEYLMFVGDTLRDKQQAVVKYERARQLYQRLGDRPGLAKAFFDLGDSYNVIGRKKESLEALQRSLELAQALPDPLRAMWALLVLGNVHADLRDYAASESALQRVLAMSQTLQHRKLEALARSGLGRIYNESGRLLAARAQLDDALAIYDALGEEFEKARVLRMLGLVERNLGNYAEALQLQSTALATLQGLPRPRPRQEAAQYTIIGLIYNLLGQHDLARKYHRAAYERFIASHGRPEDIAAALANLGETLVYLDSLPQANACLQEALRQVESPENAAVRAEMFQMLGDLKLKQGDWQAAQEIFQRALQINAAKGFTATLILNHLGLGQFHLAARHWEAAEREFEQAIALASNSGITAHVWKGFYGRGQALKAQGRVGEALQSFQAAIDTIEATLSHLQEEGSKLGYFAEKQDVYDEIILTHLQEQKDAVQSYNFVERAKARSFLDQLYGGLEIVRHVDALHPNQPRLALLSLSVSARPEAREIQAALGGRDKIIEYRVLPDRLAIWVVDRQQVTSTQVTLRREELRQLVREFRRAAGAENFSAFSQRWQRDRDAAFQDFLRVAQRLSAVLIKPVWPHLQAGQNIYFIPDDLLHYLPFAALTLPAPDSTRFLVEAMPLAMAPSAAVLKYTLLRGREQRGHAGLRVFAIANPADRSGRLKPLPWAEKTAQLIMQHSAAGSKSLVREQAYKEALLRGLQEPYDILHFAGHCSVDVKSPLYTTLYLATAPQAGTMAAPADGAGNEHLRMYEVFRLNLRQTRLVVLSACNTALGQYAQGEGIVGLSRAFFCAGTPCLLTTMWAVDARAASNVMEKFYLNLKTGGQHVAGALRNAQREEIARIRKDPVMRFHPHPYFWASFQAVGNAYYIQFDKPSNPPESIAQNH
ncbi:MAG: CHAT domain-containing protein [candidate division KSB1 bacterium]|nr:CHAT domain-containing protein [candidate division KSB1 bacterium]MDZ7274786.1 CHAT domain-containing protein [candidate division KSB1 bacterium]MDZ7285610.1 CHAT domain-containing protein [candidate division KSB1 bacterium]MDZ7298642.1 CHAT domain-containing protein [candidate division KSB1 bacterium]MDZ7307482.1 CHAT domain-containing protein [candidate division KSB1 bacterium]